MTGSKLRVGVTGAGQLGTALAARARECRAEVVAVHDLSADAAQALAQEHRAETATTSLDDFFGVEMDALIVATVPSVRLEPIRRACAKGVHLLVEKPPALTLAEGKECMAAIAEAGVISSVGFQLRFEPVYVRLQQLLEGQAVHLVRSVLTVDPYPNFEMPPWFLQTGLSGGPMVHDAIHLLDAARFLCDDAPARRAFAVGARNMAVDRTEFDVDNVVQTVYVLANGVLGVHTNDLGHERFSFELEVLGPRVRLTASLAAVESKVEGEEDPAEEATVSGYVDGREVRETLPSETAVDLGRRKVAAWLQAIATGDAGLVHSPYGDALHTLALAEAAARSQGSGLWEEVDPAGSDAGSNEARGG